MPYRFLADDKSAQAGLRRIALEQIDRGLAELDVSDLDQAERVHQLRKRLKKLRGLIRLVRPGFAGYARENAALRDAAKRLSALRDSDVLLETHDSLVTADDRDADRYAALRTTLVAGAAVPQRPEDPAQILAEFRAELLELRERAAHWTLSGKDRKVLGQGMAKTLKRAIGAMATAKDVRAPEAIHEWRKRVKYHWYHARLLRPIHPGTLKPRAKSADRLAEDLGDHHDLAVYLDALGGLELASEAEPLRQELRALALTRQAELEHQAFARGEELFDMPTGKARKRWKGWWRDWRRRN